jgi:hypothetical protein
MEDIATQNEAGIFLVASRTSRAEQWSSNPDPLFSSSSTATSADVGLLNTAGRRSLPGSLRGYARGWSAGSRGRASGGGVGVGLVFFFAKRQDASSLLDAVLAVRTCASQGDGRQEHVFRGG